MKEAVRVEKSILRFRLVQIRNWTHQRLCELRSSAIRLYKKLDDWIQVAQKTEMDAIEEMCKVVKSAVESEEKIQSELRIKFMDFTVDQGALNFITPKPPRLEALEEYREDRFAIPQLQCLFAELSEIAKSSGDSMQVVEIASLLFSKIKLSVQFGGYESALPASWNKLSLPDIISIVRNLDPENTGFVNWKDLFTLMVLQCSPIPSEVDTKGLKMENGFAEKEAFVAHKWWFAATEGSADREYSHVFERVRMVSELLFEANKTTVEGGRSVVNVGEFCRKMTARRGASFFEVLFAPVRL